MDTLRLWLSHQIDTLRSSLWVIPAFGVGIGVAGAFLLAPLGDTGAGVLPLFTGSADSARSVLSVIAGSTMTVTSLTFSLTVVALQVASGQFTPRLMRSFLSDRGNKIVLAIFLGTFTMSMVLLQSVQAETELFRLQVPILGVSLAIVSVLASIIALVYFIHHLTQQLRIDRVMTRVADDTIRAVESNYRPARLGDDEADEVEFPDDAIAVPAPRSGHLNDFDVDAMLDAAREADLTVRIRPAIGAFVVAGTTLAWVWSREGCAPDEEVCASVVRDHVLLSSDRTLAHDPAFGIRQLVDIGSRALSPGINDPTTAVEAIQHLSRVLRALTVRDLGLLVRAGGGSTVMFPRPSFGAHVGLAINQLLHYGAADAAVLRALAELLRDVGEGLEGSSRRHVLVAHLDHLEEVATEQHLSELERPAVDDAIGVARRVLAGEEAGAEAHAS